MVRIAIVDDDREDLELLQEQLRRYFQSRGEDCSVFPFSDGEDLLQTYSASYDILFLDVEMRWSNGIDVARSLRDRDQDTVIIFVSRLAQYAVEGYSVNAFDYILKPVEYSSFEKKLDRALRHLASHRSHKIRIASGGDYIWLSSDEIRYIEVYGHYLVYHSTRGDFSTGGAINAVAEELAPLHFIQCTRFSLVNLKHVTGVDGDNVILGRDQLPISRRRRKALLDALLRYNGGGV